MTDLLRIVFMGTPELAATVLRHVLDWDKGRVVAVYSQPDRPAGRGLALQPSPVKRVALEREIPVFQPLNFKSASAADQLRELAPDYLFVAAYGLLLPQAVLDIPRRAPLNVHTSLLPRYRGAAPIQRAVMNGDAETGISIMLMEAGLDTGPVLLQQRLALEERETAGSLHDKLAALGGPLLTAAVEGLEQGSLTPHPQTEEGASYAAKLEKREGLIDFCWDARRVDAMLRGVTPWPGAYGMLLREGERPLRVGFVSGMVIQNEESYGEEAPGTVIGLRDGLLVLRCGSGLYGLSQVKPAGKGVMEAAAFVNGYLKGRNGCIFAAHE